MNYSDYVSDLSSALDRAKQLSEQIEHVVHQITQCFMRGNKVLICGNGGSAADAQHFAAELIGRYKLNRDALPAIALTTDTSALTALANDFSFDMIFSRQVSALGIKGDILIGISTSGNSKNVLEALDEALNLGMHCILMTGAKADKDLSRIDVIQVPSVETDVIQTVHLSLYHYICCEVERRLFA